MEISDLLGVKSFSYLVISLTLVVMVMSGLTSATETEPVVDEEEFNTKLYFGMVLGMMTILGTFLYIVKSLNGHRKNS